MTWIGVAVVALLLSAGFWLRHYLLNHCLECKKRTDWNKYASCDECEARHKARIKEYEEKHMERMIADFHEMDDRSDADLKEFGFSAWEFLDVPCPVCTGGAPKTHRTIMRERGFSGDHKKCWDFLWNTHFPLSKKAHIERESRKFWKRWLYAPPSKEEANAMGQMVWMLQNTLHGGPADDPRLREYKPYIEKPDHWMDMTTKQPLKRRLAHAKSMLGI